MSVFVLKIIAIVTMIIDHLSFLFYGDSFSWMRYIGRISFPIFAFLIVEGYSHTKNIKKYILRLLAFSLISQYPYDLFNSSRMDNICLNVGFTLLLGLLSIFLFEKVNEIIDKLKVDKIDKYIYKISSLIIVFIFSMLALLINCDYSIYGVVQIFLFHIFRKNKILLNISYITLLIIYYFSDILSNILNIELIIKFIFYLIPLILIYLYNGKKGYSLKYLFYLIYPIHLLILGIMEKILIIN